MLCRAVAVFQRLGESGQFIGERTISIPWQVIVNTRVTIEGFSLMSWVAEDRKNRKKFVGILEAMAKLINSSKLRAPSSTCSPAPDGAGGRESSGIAAAVGSSIITAGAPRWGSSRAWCATLKFEMQGVCMRMRRGGL